MTTFSGSPIWRVISIGANPERGVSAFLRHDGKAFACRWQRCGFRYEPLDVYGFPRLVLAEEILEHARTHGVEI